MNYLVLLDAGPLGLATNPRESDQTKRCNAWLNGLLRAGVRVMVPEGADFEVRRELIRAGRPKGVARLDDLAERIEYLPITTPTYRLAAELWARLRNEGLQTADDKEVDFDVILGAQSQLARDDETVVVVATTNIGHLGRFCDAREWERIGPHPIDPTSVEGVEFSGETTLDDIINQDVHVILKPDSGRGIVDVTNLCRTFVWDGRLWIDLIPDEPHLRMKYVAVVPPDAIVARNDISLELGRFAIFVDRSTDAGGLIEAAVRARNSRN